MSTLLALSLASGLLACGDKADDTGALEANIILTDANNFSYTGDISVPSYTTHSGADVEVCWSNLTKDLQCHDLDPIADIDNVGLVRFPHMTQDEVETGLSENSLLQSDISGYVEWNTDHSATCINLSEMSFFGTEININKEYTEAGGTYMLLLAEGLEPGVGARMISFLAPSADSDVASVELEDNGCDLLDFEADVESLTPAAAPADGPWVVDWSGITVDGLGAEITLENIDGVMLGFYEGKTPADLEAIFLDLQEPGVATELHEVTLEGGSTFDLGSIDGFSGFSGDGTWVLALTCSRCYNPAPLFLTIVEPS